MRTLPSLPKCGLQAARFAGYDRAPCFAENAFICIAESPGELDTYAKAVKHVVGGLRLLGEETKTMTVPVAPGLWYVIVETPESGREDISRTLNFFPLGG